ncbi:DUF7544 domain-containing protein [Natronorarus salvus]|uniref:DUF7544 domain-containing protein n=1 Tax=Natronorarus salvus TaxID=3117733 RepID=UPI002F2676A1
MSWHALVAAREAVGATRALLAGRSIPDWARLSVLAVFVGGPTTTLVADFNRGPLVTNPLAVDPTDPGLLSIAVVGLALGTLVLFAFLLAGAVFEFVLLDTLRGRPVRLLGPLPGHLRPGLDLFVFRLVLYGLVIVALVGALAAFVGVEPVDGRHATVGSLSFVAVALVCLTVSRLTSRLVAPIMLVEGCSLREGWRHLLRRVDARPDRYAVYLVVDLSALAVVFVFGAVLGALVALAVALPIGTFGLGVGSLLVAGGLSEGIVSGVTGALLVPPYLLATLALVGLVHVPATVYVRYLALLTLAGTDRRYARGTAGAR